jgi:drug/metabolite transporter (DMT)-like permease
VVLGFTGVLIMGLDPSVLSDRQQVLGLCLMLCVALLSGVNYALFKGQLRSRGPDEVLMYDNLVGALLLSPFLFSSVGDISMRSMVAVGCYAGLVGTLGYFIMYAGLKRVRPATASALSYLEVAAGAVLGVVAFHEPVGIRMILGAVCIIVAASLVRTRDA